MKNLLKPGLHWLLIFIPIAIVLDLRHASAPLVFFSSALAIIPIARGIGLSTEHLATYTGDAIGGLLNATFGNAPELIIALIALNKGLHDIVLASLAGTILANLLLALGVSFLVGGIRVKSQAYNASTIRMYSSMMMIAVLSLTVPSAFHRFMGSNVTSREEDMLNISLAIALLLAYFLYLIFMIKTHPDFFRSVGQDAEEEHHEGTWSMKKAIVVLVGSSLLAAFMSEILVGAAEETGSVLGMSPVFIGVIFLAVIGGAAESISAISMAAKNKMDLSIGIALGSSIQIAIFIAPLLVLLSLFIGPGMLHLAFSRALIGSLFLGVILAAMISGDGQSNWYKGVQLILVYLILAMMFFFAPAT